MDSSSWNPDIEGRRNAWIIVICGLLNGTLLYLSSVVLFYYRELGTVKLVSTVFSVEALAVVLTEVPSGAVADLFGRKYTMLVASAFKLVGGLWLLFGGAFGVFGGVVLSAVSQSMASGTVSAMLYDSLMTNKKSKDDAVYQKFSAWSGASWPLGACLGCSLGGLLLWIYPTWLEGPIICTTLPLAVSVGLTLFVKEPPYKKNEHCNVFRQIRDAGNSLWKSGNLMKLLVAQSIIEGIGEPVHYMDGLYFTHMRVPSSMLGVIGAGEYSWSSLGNSLSYGVYQLFGYKPTLLVTIVLGAVANFTSTHFVENPWIAIPLFVFPSFCFGIRFPLYNTMVNRAVDSSERATIISFFSLATQLSISCLSIVLGWLIDYTDVVIGFRIAAVATLCAAGLLGTVSFRNNDKKSDKDE